MKKLMKPAYRSDELYKVNYRHLKKRENLRILSFKTLIPLMLLLAITHDAFSAPPKLQLRSKEATNSIEDAMHQVFIRRFGSDYLGLHFSLISSNYEDTQTNKDINETQEQKASLAGLMIDYEQAFFLNAMAKGKLKAMQPDTKAWKDHVSGFFGINYVPPILKVIGFGVGIDFEVNTQNIKNEKGSPVVVLHRALNVYAGFQFRQLLSSTGPRKWQLSGYGHLIGPGKEFDTGTEAELSLQTYKVEQFVSVQRRQGQMSEISTAARRRSTFGLGAIYRAYKGQQFLETSEEYLIDSKQVQVFLSFGYWWL